MTKFKLSEKIISGDGHTYTNFIFAEDVKEFIRLLKEEKNDSEARIIGMVWGLSHETNFNVKMFNQEFDRIRKGHLNRIDNLSGDLR